MKLDTAILILIALGFIAGSIVSESQHRRIKNLQTEIDELKILFNQKFLQEMVVNKPVVRFEF
jgi:hypothetical protein